MTVEIFYPGDAGPDESEFRDFADGLMAALEPILPEDRATYHIP